MSLLDAIFKRRSIRRYKRQPIPDDVLKNILEAGRLAPSANNLQPWHFIVVTDQKLKEGLIRGTWNRFIKDAPVVIVGCGDKRDEWSTVDVAIALENMVIAAAAQEIGSCWIGDFDEGKVRKLLNIPNNLKVVAMITLGYPDEEPEMPSKKRLEEIVHYNGF